MCVEESVRERKGSACGTAVGACSDSDVSPELCWDAGDSWHLENGELLSKGCLSSDGQRRGFKSVLRLEFDDVRGPRVTELPIS